MACWPAGSTGSHVAECVGGFCPSAGLVLAARLPLWVPADRRKVWWRFGLAAAAAGASFLALDIRLSLPLITEITDCYSLHSSGWPVHSGIILGCLFSPLCLSWDVSCAMVENIISLLSSCPHKQ